MSLCVASQLVVIVVSVCFVIDSVRKLLDTPYVHPQVTHFYCCLVTLSVKVATG
jgi:hypothetical protein